MHKSCVVHSNCPCEFDEVNGCSGATEIAIDFVELFLSETDSKYLLEANIQYTTSVVKSNEQSSPVFIPEVFVSQVENADGSWGG